MKTFRKIGLTTVLCLISYQAFGDINTEYPPYSIVGMATQEILDKSQHLQELQPDSYKLKIDLGSEVIYELIGEEDHLGWSLAIADITQSVPHYHKNTLETYSVVSGILEVTVDDKSYVLHAGDSFVIPINSVHSAKSLTNEPSRILVSCLPPWTHGDHNIADETSPTNNHGE